MERRGKNRTFRLMKARIYSIMWKTDLYAIRFLLAMCAITWGTYSFSLWSSLFIIQGAVMLWSLLCDKRPKSTLWVDAVLGCALWTHTALSPSMSMGIEIWIASASWWLLVRYYSDEEKSNVVIR